MSTATNSVLTGGSIRRSEAGDVENEAFENINAAYYENNDIFAEENISYNEALKEDAVIVSKKEFSWKKV